MTSRLIHPRMMSELARDFWTESCAIQESTPSQDTAGELIESWSTVTGLGDLDCRVMATGGGERRLQREKYAEMTHVISISGHYSAITEQMRAVVDGQAYDILLVETSTEQALTRLLTRIVR